MIPVLDSRQMRRADEETIRSGTPSAVLMENAGQKLVEEMSRWFPGWRRIVVACGPGNNGGDGLAAARLAAARGHAVSVFTLRDPGLYRGDPAEKAEGARRAGLSLQSLSQRGGLTAFRRSLADADGVLDALFGTGLSRPLEGDAARAVGAVDSAQRPVLAADLPSGLSADQGGLLGPTVTAACTVALAALKKCHVLAPARDFCGRIVVADIGIQRSLLEAIRSDLRQTEPADILVLLPARRRNSHKGDFGRLAIVAGSRGKAGAAVLCARGALRAGAGLVTVFCAKTIEPIVVGAIPESMTHPLEESTGTLAPEAAGELTKTLADFDAVVVGPGLTTRSGAVAAVRAVLATGLPLVCDADALNAFAGKPGVFGRRRAPTILTPHPGEAARLLGRSTREIQADRLGSARRLARRSRATVLLKGDATLVAVPDGKTTVNPTGSPLMATAGAGDVLAGAIGALLAGGMPAEEAAIAAAYLHGAAGDALSEELGDAGLLAHELADAIPRVRSELRRKTENGKRETGIDWNQKL